jgi:nitrile hydratase
MNGIHDMGGMDNMGPLVVEHDEPVFHEDWERTMFGIAVSLLGAGYFNLDEIRRATETIPPAEYLQMSYYEGWMKAIVTLLLEKGLVTEEELARGAALNRNPPPRPALPKEMALYAVYNNIPSSVDRDIPARFRPGDGIIAKNIHSRRHTRMPRYVRGKRGSIVQDLGIFLLPDTNAHGGPDRPQHVYSVRFSARELWGDDYPAGDSVHVDLWEEYMEPQAG